MQVRPDQPAAAQPSAQQPPSDAQNPHSPRVNLLLFLTGILLLGITGGIYETTFNNFLSDTFNMTADDRGLLELPREFPGFAVVFLTGLFFFLPETKIAALATFGVGAGLFGLAYMGTSWGWMIAFTVVWSTGVHTMMVMRSALSLGLAKQQQQGRRLGQVQGVNTAATIIGAGLVWLLLTYCTIDYALVFQIGGGLAILSGIVLWRMRMPGGNLTRPKFVWRKKYWLYYLMALTFGARKQVFITFAPWVLVKLYGQPAGVMAQLWIASAVLGIFFQPALGRLIDRLGEKAVLTFDSVMVALVCLGYGLSHLFSEPSAALWLLYACFVTDNLMFGTNMARTTYLTKIAARREDVSPTLSLGITLDHAVAMVLPFFAGMLWEQYGHETVFLGATGIAALMFLFTRFIPNHRALNRIQIINRCGT